MAPTRLLPAPLKIGPYEWPIIADADIWKTEHKSEDSNAICDTENIRILLDPDALDGNPIRLRMLVTHEVFHACFFTSHADLDMRNEDDAEESFVNSAAPMFLQVLRDNPRFVQWLQA